MPHLQSDLMRILYQDDIWRNVAFDKAYVDHQGWNGKHSMLQRIALSATSPVVLDVGVWKGESTLTIAAAMRKAGIDGCVISIDTFLGSEEHWHQGELFSRRAGQPDIYKRFLANVLSQDLQSYVIPLPQTSSTAARVLKQLGIAASAAHIDASHFYQDVLDDAKNYWELLLDGGVLVGDDYVEGWPEVIQAAGDFSRFVGKPLLVDPPKWLIQKSF